MALVRRLLFLLPLLLLTGCSSRPQGTTNAAANVVSTDVDPSRLQPAQGRVSPGVLVYDKGGTMVGRVIKIAPDHVFANGPRGGVLLNYDDAQKQDLGYAPFKMLDTWYVLKQ